MSGRYRSIYGEVLGIDQSDVLLRGVPIGGGSASYPDTRVVTAAGSVTVDEDTDDHILLNKTIGAATTVNLPAAATRTEGRHIKIVDIKGDAASNNITITPDGAETIVGLSTWVIANNYGSVTLWPMSGGWYV